ncbi:hypothetical protein N0036_08590 [Pseudomonas aeruginosa]|uniref:hypothetical protein n=1 Tax=Pseudomonas aeruginosa TaxID=287 RepID=UPI00053F25B4|nr:hypothetical protein [Pseudomonas aeruginosa]MCO2030153.1 hypothetical protein [Pseudomonas aeruginosa]MCS7675694.1 hypothetical protein [Pseudomonas aeruginosa]MCS7905001.1 hypothetical protein [Pseudomonas aeruginosa]MCS9345764.1 hypothetical protein [Pseudomonas aeruginosa]MCS9358603.1 hypothetical protein [Pseudomonas aeruginosa]
MYNSLLLKLIRCLFGTSPSNSYQHRIEPTIGQAYVFPDTEDFLPVVTADDTTWTVDDLVHTQPQLAITEWSGQDCSFGHDHLEINPASGLPMLDSVIDVAGNVYGTDSMSIDLSSDWS